MIRRFFKKLLLFKLIITLWDLTKAKNITMNIKLNCCIAILTEKVFMLKL